MRVGQISNLCPSSRKKHKEEMIWPNGERAFVSSVARRLTKRRFVITMRRRIMHRRGRAGFRDV